MFLTQALAEALTLSHYRLSGCGKHEHTRTHTGFLILFCWCLHSRRIVWVSNGAGKVDYGGVNGFLPGVHHPRLTVAREEGVRWPKENQRKAERAAPLRAAWLILDTTNRQLQRLLTWLYRQPESSGDLCSRVSYCDCIHLALLELRRCSRAWGARYGVLDHCLRDNRSLPRQLSGGADGKSSTFAGHSAFDHYLGAWIDRDHNGCRRIGQCAAVWRPGGHSPCGHRAWLVVLHRVYNHAGRLHIRRSDGYGFP